MIINAFNSWNLPESGDRLEVVFNERFKDYGAYYVRKNYTKSKILATILACVTALLASASPLILEKFKGEQKNSKGVIIETSNPVATVIDDDDPPVKPAVSQYNAIPENFNTQAYLPPVVNEHAITDVPAPSLAEISNPGTRNQLGTDEQFEGYNAFHNQGETGPLINNAEPIADAKLDAVFPGGAKAFEKFITDNFEYPERCKDLGIEGYVLLKFVVDLQGRISRIEPIEQNVRCEEFTKEAIRVLKLSPPWIPAQNNGKFTIAWRQLPIKLSLGAE